MDDGLTRRSLQASEKRTGVVELASDDPGTVQHRLTADDVHRAAVMDDVMAVVMTMQAIVADRCGRSTDGGTRERDRNESLEAGGDDAHDDFPRMRWTGSAPPD